MDSILTSIKKLLGPSAEYEYFDPDIIMHINTVFMELAQIGVGPAEGFVIEDESSKWTDFISEDEANTMGGMEGVKTYIYLKVKLLFDPPTSGTHIDSINKQIDRLEWRLYAAAESGEEENQNG